MIKAEHIRSLRKESDDYEETERLKAKFSRLRKERHPFYLTLPEFNEVLLWKLRTQIGRKKKWHSSNTDEIIRSVTSLAFSITCNDEEYELELRFRILCSLRGVGIPVASAFLALVFPEKYCVIDFRGWRQVFGEEKRTFSISDYKRYLEKVRSISEELKWSVQEVDLAIWEYDRRNSQ